MTMLDRMRRHKGWLKWSLALVVFTFIIFYIPDFLRGKGGPTGLPSDEIARVNGRGISVLEFRQAYQRQVAAYRVGLRPEHQRAAPQAARASSSRCCSSW